MAQVPKQLTPATSPVHYAGAEIRGLRERDGLSQADLGKLLVQGTDLVRKVEDGSRVPSRAFVEGCDTVFHTGGALHRLWPLLERERQLRLDSRDTAPIPGAGYQSAAPDRLVLDWFLRRAARHRIAAAR